MIPTARSEEARGFYQQRLALMYQVGFAINAVFLLGLVAVSALVGQDLAGAVRSPSRAFHLAATGVLGVLWWVLSRRRLRQRVLAGVDTAGVLVLSLLFNLMAGLYAVRAVAVLVFALVPGLVSVIRAVVVPSTPRHTLLLGLGQAVVALPIFFLSAFHPSWPVVQRSDAGWPLPVQLVSYLLWLGALVATATVASRVIYHLRREVRAARRLGQYVLGDKLGEGGMGTVYRATHALLRRDTALKLLPPDTVGASAVRRFEREVVQTARLRHPNTVAIFDYGHTPDGIFYYAMEYFDGLHIGELVEREGPLPPGRVVWLLAQVCASLEEAHSIGLVHRDIKPANVMVVGHVAAWDLVKVLDFGLVKSLSPFDQETSLPSDRELVGTPLYMAPEALTQPGAVEARSDLYAVAALGYFMLAGRHVFEGSSLVEICAAHLHTPPRPVHERLGRSVPPELEALLLRGLAKSPADRPPSAAAFREALLGCEVPPWREADARAWWRANGERLRRREERPLDLAYAPTITVAYDSA